MKCTLGIRTSNQTTGECAWEIRTGATPGRVKLIELGIFLAEATATTIGLGRPAAIGITPTTPVDFLPVDPNNVLATGIIQSSLAWGTKPTIPAAFLRRIALPAVIGTGVIWTFPEGITIPVSYSLILWNLASNSLLDAYAVVEL
jgi:hypothetical protein